MIVLDIETTGLDPNRNSILEIAAFDFFNPANFFFQKCRARQEGEIDSNALQINGNSKKEIFSKERPEVGDIILNFLTWLEPIESKTIGGQNVDFDISFLLINMKILNIKNPLGHRKVDQHSLAYAHYLSRDLSPPLKNKYSRLSGDAIMTYVGLPHEPIPHNALNGAKFATEAINRLIYGENKIFDFKHYPVPIYLINPH